MKVKLFAAINAADFITCYGYEVSGFEAQSPAIPGPMTLSCNDSDDDNEWHFADQDIDLVEGSAMAKDVNGEEYGLEFSMVVPMTEKDLK